MNIFEGETLSEQLSQKGYHVQNDINLLRQFLTEGSSFLDLGANIGWYTIIGSMLVGPTGFVHAFEPDDRNMNMLKSNIDINKLTNVYTYKCAVLDEDKTINFYSNPENYGDHSIASSTYQRCFQVNQDFANPHVIHGRSVDSIFQDEIEEFTNVGLIKIDIQGCEGPALRGMKRMLHYHRPPILLEYSPAHIYAADSSPFEIFAFIENHKYTPFVVLPREKNPVELHPLTITSLFEETAKHHNTFVGMDLLLLPN